MKKTKVVCLGDSLTEGYEISKSKRWSNLLSAELGIEIINSGISGDTTTGMLSRFHNMVIAHEPSHVIIMGGTNDLWLRQTEQQIIANIHAMTRQAKFNGIESIIGIPTPVYPPEGSPEESTFLDDFSLSEKMTLFQKRLKQYAKEDEKIIIDFSDGMPAHLFLDDGVHPNEKGQVVMMEKAKSVLKNIRYS